MLHDWGSRDLDFINTNTHIRERLLAIANASETHVCVPLQGSGTFIVEAGLCTMIPADGKALILVNGAYGKRMAKILDYASRSYLIQETPEDQAPNIDKLDKALAADVDISHVLAVHCETTSGILNPIQEIANIVKSRGRSLFIDAMSAFGASNLDANHVYFYALVASSNKCLEGVPGVGFALIRTKTLEGCKSNSHSLSLDLYDQWKNMENNAQWRFTPPTHVIAAFDKAIEQFEAEGGVAGRFSDASESESDCGSGGHCSAGTPAQPKEAKTTPTPMPLSVLLTYKGRCSPGTTTDLLGSVSVVTLPTHLPS